VLGAPVRGRRGEDGLTVVEVSVVSAVMLIVVAAFFAVFGALSRSERRSQALVTNEQNVRFAMTEMARDIRSSNQLVPLKIEDAHAYDHKIEMALGPAAGPQQYVQWVYDPVQRKIGRNLLSGPGGSVTSSSQRLIRVRNAESTEPLFEYFGQSGGDDLVAQGVADNVANCAIRVRITVIADSEPGPVPFRETRDVEVRNRLPGGVGCG
jgi:hypothetical protein